MAVDGLSKHTHFCSLNTHIIAASVAEIFVKEISKLHGFPSNIVFFRDPVFISNFWRELLQLEGATFSTSSAYHAQSDDKRKLWTKHWKIICAASPLSSPVLGSNSYYRLSDITTQHGTFRFRWPLSKQSLSAHHLLSTTISKGQPAMLQWKIFWLSVPIFWSDYAITLLKPSCAWRIKLMLIATISPNVSRPPALKQAEQALLRSILGARMNWANRLQNSSFAGCEDLQRTARVLAETMR